MNRKQIISNFKRVSAEIQRAKQEIAKDIGQLLEIQGLTQQEAAFIMNDAPSQVSLVCTGKLRGFSFERLLRMRAMLGAAIAIGISEQTRPTVRVA